MQGTPGDPSQCVAGNTSHGVTLGIELSLFKLLDVNIKSPQPHLEGFHPARACLLLSTLLGVTHECHSCNSEVPTKPRALASSGVRPLFRVLRTAVVVQVTPKGMRRKGSMSSKAQGSQDSSPPFSPDRYLAEPLRPLLGISVGSPQPASPLVPIHSFGK